MIIRGLRLKERLLQAAWFFQGELGLKTEKLCQVEEGSAVLTAETQAGNFMKPHNRHRRFEKERGKRRLNKYDNNYSSNKRENSPKMGSNAE